MTGLLCLLRLSMSSGIKRGLAELEGDDGRPGSLPPSLSRPISPPSKKPRLAAKIIPSPFSLTKIRDLPDHLNVDTVTIEDILGDPLIAECWNFNYLHDIDFIMGAFDKDVRSLIKLRVIHGFWKREDPNRLS